MRSPVILADVTQFFRDPYASGIQRVIWGLAAHWPDDLATGEFVYSLNGHSFRTLSGPALAEIISDLFITERPRSEWKELVQEAGRKSSAPAVPLDVLLARANVWLLPEITYDRSILRVFDKAGRTLPTAMVFYDAFTETHPEAYPQGVGYSAVSQYSRRAAACGSTISISAYSQDVLMTRLRRQAGNSTVVHPGGDHVDVLHSSTPSSPTFAVVSTLEARKRHLNIINAFRTLSRTVPNARLILAGRSSGTSKSIEEAITEAINEGCRIRWYSSPTDAQIRQVYESSSAVLSIGDEGYGISVVEAIRQGCPVAFSGIQPAGQVCEGIGAYPLSSPSVDAVYEFMLAASNNSFAQQLRDAVDPTAAPRWSDFARGVVTGALSSNPKFSS